MAKQMDYQKESFGDYSEQVEDYTKRKLVPMPKTAEARKLWEMVDPLFYTEKLTMPKFLINGNNDPYWTTDALNLYWGELKGNKYVCYVPNAGHDLKQTIDGQEDRSRAINSLAAFARTIITGKSLPKLEWKHETVDGKFRLTVDSSAPPKSARLWVAEAPTRDFRLFPWKEQAVKVDKNKVIGFVDAPKSGCLAFYGDLEYEIDGIPYHLCTQIRIVGKPK
jgi:PhoPQ-activated pathogenicity-related protein